jgi:hypothetical protein
MTQTVLFMHVYSFFLSMLHVDCLLEILIVGVFASQERVSLERVSLLTITNRGYDTLNCLPCKMPGSESSKGAPLLEILAA